MLSVIYKQIYETDENGVKEWVLIIYDISANHYVGIPVYKTEEKGTIYCRSIDKYVINDNELDVNNLKQNAIYWVNFGVGVGSELRKLRPAILWKHTGDKNLWTMIPLTTKKRKDKYYFHCDLECLAEGTAKIENMMNLSPKRILAPYFSKDKLAIITNNDYSKIKNAISKYYLFGEN